MLLTLLEIRGEFLTEPYVASCYNRRRASYPPLQVPSRPSTCFVLLGRSGLLRVFVVAVFLDFGLHYGDALAGTEGKGGVEVILKFKSFL